MWRLITQKSGPCGEYVVLQHAGETSERRSRCHCRQAAAREDSWRQELHERSPLARERLLRHRQGRIAFLVTVVADGVQQALEQTNGLSVGSSTERAVQQAFGVFSARSSLAKFISGTDSVAYLNCKVNSCIYSFNDLHT